MKRIRAIVETSVMVGIVYAMFIYGTLKMVKHDLRARFVI